MLLKRFLSLQAYENFRKRTVGEVLTEIFEIILKKMKTNDGRYWKDVVAMLTTEKQEQNDENNEKGDMTGDNLVPVVKKVNFWQCI